MFQTIHIEGLKKNQGIEWSKSNQIRYEKNGTGKCVQTGQVQKGPNLQGFMLSAGREKIFTAAEPKGIHGSYKGEKKIKFN